MVTIIPKTPGFGERLGTAIGGGLGAGFQQGASKAQEFQQKMMQQKELTNELVKYGIDPETARLYSKFTTGGQTEFAKDILESRRRGMDSFGQRTTKPFDKLSEESPQQPVEGKTEEDLGSFSEDQGLTPSEKVKRQSERYKSNLPIYQEAGEKLRSFSRQKDNFSILSSLNKTDKLPKGLGRINVDAEGRLRLPFLASTEAQRFVKTVNDFTTQAKDSYGARVTNFDLNQFMQRLPTLLNTKKGREQIISQMELINDINSVYYKNLKNTYDKSGGVRKIDADTAESIADKSSEPQINKLQKKFADISLSSYETKSGKIQMRSPNGKLGYVDKNRVQEAQSKGFTLDDTNL